ncbi:hypothetical protein Trydic_g3930 [Trypoxylus dichotomus]
MKLGCAYSQSKAGRPTALFRRVRLTIETQFRQQLGGVCDCDARAGKDVVFVAYSNPPQHDTNTLKLGRILHEADHVCISEDLNMQLEGGHRPILIQIGPFNHFTALPDYGSRYYYLQQKTDCRYGVSGSGESVRQNPPRGMLLKMEDCAFPALIPKTIRSYLPNRRFCSVVNDSGSSTKRMESGIPQGSALAPVLFTIYIRSISKP